VLSLIVLMFYIDLIELDDDLLEKNEDTIVYEYDP